MLTSKSLTNDHPLLPLSCFTEVAKTSVTSRQHHFAAKTGLLLSPATSAGALPAP
ncbi:MAG: hypothetical protein ABJZ55_17505 [Fuerstiella sp.]